MHQAHSSHRNNVDSAAYPVRQILSQSDEGFHSLCIEIKSLYSLQLHLRCYVSHLTCWKDLANRSHLPALPPTHVLTAAGIMTQDTSFDAPSDDLTALTAEITAGYLHGNARPATGIPEVISLVYDALRQLGQPVV